MTSTKGARASGAKAEKEEKSVAQSWHLATRLIHGGTERSPHGETSEALYLTSGYVYDRAEDAEARFRGDQAGYVYSRYGNPTVAMFEERMRLLEGAEAARATATGMAAVTGVLLGQLQAGDHVVAAKALFGACRHVIETLLPRFGIATTLVDGEDLSAWRDARRPETRLFFLESPTNPTLALVDIAQVAAIAHEADAALVVDNVFATPMLQAPLSLGADFVVYSATKHIDGQGRCLGGIILGPEAKLNGTIGDFLRQTGPSLSPFNAWVLLKGLETLPLRVTQLTETASRLADFLAAQPKVLRVLYPGRPDHPQYDLARRQMSGGGGLLAFELDTDKAGAFRFLNALRLIRISNNLGDAKSLITHPATTTHQKLSPAARAELGIGPALLRLSVGLEAWEDLQDDLAHALSVV